MTLVERLEKATGASRELDAEIGKVAGLEIHDAEHQRVPSAIEAFYQEVIGIPRYTESIDAALSLVPAGAEYEVTTLYGVARVAVGLNTEPGPFYASREDGNVALAICIASFRARLK